MVKTFATPCDALGLPCYYRAKYHVIFDMPVGPYVLHLGVKIGDENHTTGS